MSRSDRTYASCRWSKGVPQYAGVGEAGVGSGVVDNLDLVQIGPLMWCWFSHRVDLQTAQVTLIYKDDDPGFWYVDVRTHVSGHGKDSTSDVRYRRWRLGCHFKTAGRTPTIASADDLDIRNLRPKISRPRKVLTQDQIKHLSLSGTQWSRLLQPHGSHCLTPSPRGIPLRRVSG